MSTRRRVRKRHSNKRHRRTSSNILNSGIKDVEALKAILNTQHKKQEAPRKPSQGSIQATVQSIDDIFDSNSFSCNKFIIYDILCVMISFGQMLFYYSLLGEYAKSSPTLFKCSCLILLTSRFIWSLYLSHYMKHKIIDYMIVYIVILTDFVLPFFLLFKYCASDLYSKKSLNHAIRSQLFIIGIPMSIIQTIDMSINSQIPISYLLSIGVMIISVGMEFWTMIKHQSLNLKIRLFHSIALLSDIIKCLFNIYIITCCFCGKYNVFITLFTILLMIKSLIFTPCLSIIIVIKRYLRKDNIGYNAMLGRYCKGWNHHIQYCMGINITNHYFFDNLTEFDKLYTILNKLQQYIICPTLTIFVGICSFFYIWISLEIISWSSFWFIFHSHNKNSFGIHLIKLKYILSFLLQSINSFDFKIRLYCLHYILYDGYGWWQRKHYFYKIERLLQKYVNNTNKVNIEKKLDIKQFAPNDKIFLNEIIDNIQFMFSHFFQQVLKIECGEFNNYFNGDQFKLDIKTMKYYLFIPFCMLNLYGSLIFPLIYLIYNWILNDLFMFKLIFGYFCSLIIMIYCMNDYYKMMKGWWHCHLINFEYPIKLELLAPFYEYIHTYHGKMEIIKKFFGPLSEIMIDLLGYGLRKSQSIVRDGMQYASDKDQYSKEYQNFSQCKQVVLNVQKGRKIYPKFKLYLFDKHS